MYLIRIYIRILRWLSKKELPLWIADFTTFLSFLNIPACCITFWVSVFYPGHFYKRLVRIIHRSKTLKNYKPYPYLLRPVPYLLSFLAIMNLLYYFETPLFRPFELIFETGDPPLRFTLEILSSAVLMPAFAVLGVAILIAAVMIVNLLAEILSNFSDISPLFKINREFFRIITQKKFWKGFRYSEVVPALLYYSINSVIIVPLSIFIMLKLSSFMIWSMGELFSPDSNYIILVNILTILVVLVISIFSFYYLVLNPLLQAIMYRSKLISSREIEFPELLEIIEDKKE